MVLPTHPPFDVTTIGHATVVRFTEPRLDFVHVQAMEDELDALADRAGQTRLRLDFSAVTYLSSAALGKLVGLHTRAARVGCHVVLESLAPHLYELFLVTRLDQFLEVHADAVVDARRA